MSPAAIFVIHTQDAQGNPLPGVLIEAASPNGNWQGVTNACGDFNPTLAYGRYDVSLSKQGYKTETRTWVLSSPATEPILVALQRDENVFPNYPTREQVCNVFCGFQGISILTQEFGWIPAFGPETSNLNDDDLISYCQQMKSFGFTHVEFDISWRYSEADYSYPVPGRDLTKNLPEVCRILDIIIRQGMLIKFSLAGDGLSVGQSPYSYNDPQGWTYGFEWLMENLSRILDGLSNYEGHDLTRFCLFVPGYDGVFYGWTKPETPDLQPQRVINFGYYFRQLRPNGYLGIEHTTGKIPVGEGSENWKSGGVLDAFDTVLSEFNPFNLHEDSTWQIVARLAKEYIRPADQPDGDDPNPPKYLAEGCSRGQRFYIMYELVTYLWVRGEITKAQCNEIVDYFQNMAPDDTLCMIYQ